MTSFRTPEANRQGRLELNARGHRYDKRLDEAADLIDTDYEAFARLPVLVQDRASLYRDFRQHYRDAVAARAIPDDRGPHTAGKDS